MHAFRYTSILVSYIHIQINTSKCSRFTLQQNDQNRVHGYHQKVSRVVSLPYSVRETKELSFFLTVSERQQSYLSSLLCQRDSRVIFLPELDQSRTVSLLELYQRQQSYISSWTISEKHKFGLPELIVKEAQSLCISFLNFSQKDNTMFSLLAVT